MRKANLPLVCTFLIVLTSSLLDEGECSHIEKFTPDGWAKCDSASYYNRENLFSYIDGGAEAYLAYDFESLIVQRYCRDEGQITVEICQTKTSEDAFGLYSQNSFREKIGLAQRSSYDSGELRFWKGRYFVRVFSWESRDRLNREILQVGKSIAESVKEKGKLPVIFRALPKQGLIPYSERFFHKQISLNNVCFISNQGVLNLSPSTNGVIADYVVGVDSLKYLLIQYPDNIEAEKALKSYQGVVGLENGFSINRYLGIALQGKRKGSISYMLKIAQNTLEEALKDKKLTLVGVRHIEIEE